MLICMYMQQHCVQVVLYKPITFLVISTYCTYFAYVYILCFVACSLASCQPLCLPWAISRCTISQVSDFLHIFNCFNALLNSFVIATYCMFSKKLILMFIAVQIITLKRQLSPYRPNWMSTRQRTRTQVAIKVFRSLSYLTEVLMLPLHCSMS